MTAPGLELQEVVAATGGSLDLPAPGLTLRSVSIDSRTLESGALFVAIRGPRFDGHDFLAQAASRGALAALVERDVAAPHGLALIHVADTLRALGELAAHVRRAARVPVVAVTGSLGKTTTKDMIASLLATRGPVLKTEGNLNNQFGLPLTLLRLGEEHTAAVVELGMSAAGEIRALSRLARPDLAVITRVAPVHLQFFPSLDAIAKAKAEILEGLAPGGAAVLNRDDPRLVAIGARFPGRILWFGRDEAALARASDERHGAEGVAFRLHLGTDSAPVELPLAGLHFVPNFLAAAAVAHELGVGLPAIAATARSLKPARHRGELVRLGRGVTLLDDCYNSSPEALEAAVAALGRLPARRHVAILGDMLELGDAGPALHREGGRALVGRVDLVLGVGPLARELLAGAREAGLTRQSLEHAEDAAAAAQAAPGLVQPGDAVLVKGSRGIGLEAVVDALAAGFAREGA